jgi:hypothetical protein
MINGIKDRLTHEHFTVSDSNNNLISGIDSTEFTVYVYDPDNNEVSDYINGYFVDLGNGNYKYSFIPNKTGVWYITVIHQIYFPWGKSDDIYVDIEDLSGIYNIVIRTLGLTHHNIYIDNPIYDDQNNMISARVRIYNDSNSVGTDSNVIETYLITSDGTECGKFNYWKQTTL